MRRLYEGECDKCGNRHDLYCELEDDGYLYAFLTQIPCLKCKVGHYQHTFCALVVLNKMKGKWNQ